MTEEEEDLVQALKKARKERGKRKRGFKSKHEKQDAAQTENAAAANNAVPSEPIPTQIRIQVAVTNQGCALYKRYL